MAGASDTISIWDCFRSLNDMSATSSFESELRDKFEIYIHAPESEKERAKAECLEKLRKFSERAFRM